MTRRDLSLFPKSLWLSLGVVLAASSCDGTGEFEPEPVDAGFVGGGVTAAQIGAPCSYTYDGRNPDNDCADGLSCFIFTFDGRYTTGLTLPLWEDQTTLYYEERDDGFCTLVGTMTNPPACPAGTLPKVYTPGVVACLRMCTQAADCARSGYTCDVRYHDLFDPVSRAPAKTCVKECSFDVPDCVRSGIVPNPGNQQELLPALAFQDLAGASMCDTTVGICVEVPEERGTAGPGEPCSDTSQCETGSVCITGDVVGFVVGAPPPDGLGFCASPCTPAAAGNPPQANCSPGYVCQAAGNFTLGFRDTIVVDVNTRAIDLRGGFCFHQCEDASAEGSCNIPGTGCGSLDEATVNDAWNGVPMCLPPALRE